MTPTTRPSARPISPLPRMLTAARTVTRLRRPALSRSASPVPICSCILVTTPSRDLLEGAEDAAFVGGFAAAARLLGRSVDLVMLDMTDPQRPRARALSAALARIVRARAVNPRFIAGQMRHGPRGAAELAETVDRLVAFAATTGAVAGNLFDLLYDAYVADPEVRDFLLRENPAAAAAIAERLDAARRRGLWHPHRNDIATGFAALQAEVVP